MPLHPLLDDGLRRFGQRDWRGAGAAWRQAAAAAELAPVERDGLEALADLALSLGDVETEPGAAKQRYATACRRLAGLPGDLLGLDLRKLSAQLPEDPREIEAPPPLAAARAISRAALLRFGLLVGLVLAALVAFRWTPLAQMLDRETLMALLGRLEEAWWAPLFLIGLYVVLCTFGLPASPLLIIGGGIFGPVLGSLYNFLGTFGSSLVGFVLGKLLGAELAEQIAGPRLRRIERSLNRRGFWYLVSVRLMPIPFPIANFAMAMAGIRFPTYALTSALGLAPAVIAWTLFASSVLEAAKGDAKGIGGRLALVMLLLLSAVLLPSLVRSRLRRRRYLRLRAQRAQRNGLPTRRA